MDVPTVSVLVTCHDLGRYLNEAIDSVFAQTFQDFELVVVDDGSTEPETLTVLDHLARPRTRIVRIPNRGLPAARNEAFRHSVGRYISFLDADDLFEATWLEKGVARLNSGDEVAFVSHWLRAFGDETWEWTPGACDIESLLRFNCVNGAALFRREIFDRVGGFDESMRDGCEDWDFWLSIVERGMTGVVLPEVLYFYRRRQDSMSRLMFRGEAHLVLYERLIRKHAESYQRHAARLASEKEAAIRDGLRQLHDWAADEQPRLISELTRSRRNLARLRAKSDRLRRDLDEQRRQVEAAVSEARVRLEHEIDDARAALLAAVAEAARVQRDVDGLHASFSWRLTRPLRTIYDIVQRRRMLR